MASGMDSNRVVDFLNVCTGYSASNSSPYQGTLATPFSASSSHLGHLRLMSGSTLSTSTVLGSEISGGSYVQGTGMQYFTGTSGTFSAAAYSGGAGTTSTTATLTQAGMPTVTVYGMELWDSAGAAPAYAASNRWLWAQLQSPVPCTSGDNFIFSAGAVGVTFSA